MLVGLLEVVLAWSGEANRLAGESDLSMTTPWPATSAKQLDPVGHQGNHAASH